MQLKLTLLRGSCTSLWLANVKSECCSKLRLPLNLTCVFQFWILFVPVWFQGKMRILQVGTSRGLQSFPLLLVFGCYFTQKVSHVFSAPQMTFFFFFNSISKDTYTLLLFIYFSPFIFWWWAQTNLSGGQQKWHEVYIQIIDHFMYPSINQISIGFLEY